MRGCSFCCFLCFGDACLHHHLVVEGSDLAAECTSEPLNELKPDRTETDAADTLGNLPAASPPSGSTDRGAGEVIWFHGNERVFIVPPSKAQLGSGWLLKYTNALWRLLLIVYTSMITTALQFFSCREVAGTSLMRSQLGIECGTREHTAAMIVMAIIVAIAVIVMPIWLIAVMFDELGGVNMLAKRRFKGMSFYIASAYHWTKLRIAGSCIGYLLCSTFRSTITFERYQRGEPLEGWGEEDGYASSQGPGFSMELGSLYDSENSKRHKSAGLQQLASYNSFAKRDRAIIARRQDENTCEHSADGQGVLLPTSSQLIVEGDSVHDGFIRSNN